MDYEDKLTQYIINLLEEHSDTALAEAEFKRIMADDVELRESYREWCQERGYYTRRGIADFAEEYIEQHDAVWDSVNDFDDND